ncbi:short-chain dehydrogenase [Aliidongia dinghuensis]|uniref:Short-chain dehydrogenase n=1 Tax=Aliidongia dinghuensis TaxID=1867774 RepID=A0A8J3E6P0_9PROT|nr:SDR family oxidoreductase [Aliidongia dinghuensis]GGF31326.1 short-chain dehydrogenase [Aliidongia dinghuensis]
MVRRKFLVTGASKGIGLALSERLAAEGHHVVGIARGADASFPGTLVQLDLDDRAASAAALAELAARHDFDGVVNNVGLARLHAVGAIDLADVDDIFRTNLHPTIQTVQALLPGMKARGWGRIVNLSSLVSLGAMNRTAYAAAKAAVISMTRTWALELAETGITVNGVAPGPTETEMFRRNTSVGSEAERRFLALVPMRRVGQPNELAAAIAFFLAEDAGFVTGQTLFVDGGASIGKASL